MSESETKGEAREGASARDLEIAAAAEPAEVSPAPAENGVHTNGVTEGTHEAAPNEPAADPLLARGNPLRWRRGLVTLLAGGLPAFLLMAKNGQNGWGIAVGALFVAIAAFGVMDLVGSFDDDAEPATTATLESLYPTLGATLGLGIAFGAALWAAQAAIVPALVAAALVPATFLGFVAAVFQLGQKLGPYRVDELGNERPLLERHGFWVCVLGAVLYFPALGLFSLWDPWETHYGEVAREVLARDDWVSLWWAQDGWFWSKPILNFWIQALSMGALGTHYQPDRMLIAANGTAAAHAEWVVRAPNVLMTIGAMYLLYKGVAKVFGRRAGLLGAVVLATMPDWFFLAHQTMTDMPFVSAMTAAMGLLLYGLNTDEEATVRHYEVRAFGTTFKVSLWHLVFGAVLLCAIPQILYLLSRNIELVVFGDGPKGFHFHWDEFKSGSAGNCGLPGNEACTMHVPASLPKQDTWWWHKGGGGMDMFRFVMGAEPAMQALVWAGVLGGVLYLNWGERRVRRLVYVAAWLAAAVATMAKGPAGFGLPIICAFAYVGTKRRWTELLRFELVTGLLVIACVALPWYVAMYVRHGSPFTDRLIFHDMFNRAFSHVHDTNEGDDTGIRYYVWQFGYAVFPWTGLAPLGLLWGFRRSDSALARTDASRGTTAVGDASVMLVMWFLFAFALFTFMGTKFHHYIFPAVPPAAMLVGVVLDDMIGSAPMPRARALVPYVGGLALAALVATFGASRWLGGSIFGTKTGGGGSLLFALVGVAVGAAIFAAVAVTWRARVEEDTDDPTHRHEALMLGAAAVAGALFLVLVGRDLATNAAEMSGGIRLLQLFTYNYKRPWPDTLDFSAVLAGFTVVAVLVGLTLGARRLRRHAVVTMCAFATLWAVWGLDVYMTALSPHWGQHEVIEAYYRDRKSPDETLVAYQMNWKGENFYTGNRIPAFVSTGANFQQWLKKERDRGVKVMYFITEHSRTSGLRSEVGAKSYKEITDKALNNKFVVVRAEL